MTFASFDDAENYIGGFSKPSKMPCMSYSIPAQECHLGRKMREVKGSVCNSCYALKGRYLFGNVKNALYRRFDTLKKEFWVEAFAFAVNAKKMTFMRIHDAGDLQGVWHLKNLARVAELCPNTKFWLPTREAGILTEYMDTYGALPENLIVRVSGTMIDGPYPMGLVEKYNFVASKVSADINEVNCHSFKNEGKCGDCRACWDKTVKVIVYKKH